MTTIVQAIRNYQVARDEVREHLPDSWADVVKLCKQSPPAPEKISLQAVWTVGRDKPCFSNISVELGKRIADDIRKSPEFDSYETIASERWAVDLIARGRGWRRNSNFAVRGKSAERFLRKMEGGGIKSYMWRLHAIRGLAVALKSNEGAGDLVKEIVRSKGLPLAELEGWTRRFAQCAGLGWGTTTVSHMLTDLGLAVKPDIHLRRAGVLLGLVPTLPSNARESVIRAAGPQIDHQLVRTLISLSERVKATANPKARNSLREIDKVLMEWSRKGLARPL